jgi:hypothetical protein
MHSPAESWARPSPGACQNKLLQRIEVLGGRRSVPMQEVTWRGENGAAIVSPVNSASAGGQRFGHKKNKAVDAVYRQRPCQPRILKSAHAIR